MVNHGIKNAKLANGDTVFVDDHVYVSPPWSERDGTPYNVARIIEFIPPDSTPRKGRGPSQEISVRLSLYYRQTDISGRNVSDFRLLLATIHTDVHPLVNVRGKCFVRHKDRIEDLIKWKRLPDHFYFAKFFDPYIKREYDVIRTANVHNIPPGVRKVLLERYEYLVAEREIVSDLTDSFRACCVCDKWAASQDSVRCENCKKHYHMACVTPPITAKPAKGYSWVCIPCHMQRRKDVEDQKFHYGNNSATVPKPKTTTTVKAKEKMVVDLQRPDVSYRGWPWRYFGLYTRAEDALDPDDLIFPRAATRVGRNFQVNVPTWEEQQESESHRMYGEAEAGPSRHIGVERGHDIGERKHESTIEIWCTPSDDLNRYMTELRSINLPVPPYDVDCLDKGAQSYTSLGRDRGLQTMRALKLEDFPPPMFSDKEVTVFEEQLEENGGLDTHKSAQLLKRTPADVLRFSYIWKNGKLKEENEALRAHQRVSHSHARQNKTLGAPSLGRIRARASSSPLDDEVSLYNASFINSSKMQCAACSRKISSAWWRCPRTVPGVAMCEECGANYRKYGVISFVKSDDVRKSDKDKPKKKTDGASGASTPVPQPPKLPPCASCRKMEPKANMARCKICTYSVHSGCYGIAPQDMGPDWTCELCRNVELEVNRMEPRCVLCPRDNSSVKNVKSKKPGMDFDIFSAFKPTEGNLWAHVLCSLFIPEVLYRDPKTLKVIEGITTLPEERWQETCSLCNQQDGAVITCVECLAPFHTSCAWMSGYKFGFEFTLAKAGKREVVTIARFKDHEGVMLPGCWCKSHDLEGRAIYDPHEIDPEQNETALQVYTSSYKFLPPDDSFPLLRKATRLAQVLPAAPASTELEKICRDCGVDVSPQWHDAPSIKDIDTGMEIDMAFDAMPNGISNGIGHEETKMELDMDGERTKPHEDSPWLCHLCWFKY